MTWQVYQACIAEFFRRAPNANVGENVEVIGKSSTVRMLDVLVEVPIKVTFGRALEISVDVKEKEYGRNPIFYQ
jgi:hypothetical protein